MQIDRSKRSVRAAATVAALSAATLGLAGCGGGDSSGSGSGSGSGSASGAASDSSGSGSSGSGSSGSAGGSASPSSSASAATKIGQQVDGAALSKRVKSAMLAKKYAHIAMDGATKETAMRGDQVLVNEKRTDLQVTIAGATMRLIDGQYYLKLPGTSSWTKADPQSSDPQERQLGQQMTSSGSGGGENNLGVLEVSTATVGATKKVGGQTLTRYDVSTTPKKVAAILKKQYRERGLSESASQQQTTLMESIPGKITYRWWINEQSLPSTIETRSSATSAANTTITYSKWGVPVKIAVPPTGGAASS